jgi:hypothetical protein
MTDRFKGVLVTFDREIREDDAEKYIEAIKMIKGVFSVKPYIAQAEDYIMYERGIIETKSKMVDFLCEGMLKNPTK